MIGGNIRFNRWRSLAERLLTDHISRRGAVPDRALSVLRGVLGELAVLALPRFRSARWIGMKREPHDIELEDLYIEVKSSAQDRFDLSLQQIDAASDPSFYFALVDIDENAVIKLRAPAKLTRLDPIVKKNIRGIQEYLKMQNVAYRPSMCYQLGAALPHCHISFYRLKEQKGWREALQALERFGRFAVLRQECARDLWFVPAAFPGARLQSKSSTHSR